MPLNVGLNSNNRTIVLGGLLIASTVWLILVKRKNKKDNKYAHEDTLCSRGEKAILPRLRYINSFVECLQNPCDPKTNPNGYIAFCVAENKLVQEFFAQRLMKPGTAITAFSDSCVYEYNGFLGLPPAREAAAYFLARRFLLARDGGHSTICPKDPNMTEEELSQRIDPENVVIGSGCASLLGHLFFSLADHGDAVLIPLPFYSAFDRYMKLVAGCVPVGVETKNPIDGPTVEELEIAACNAEAKGLKPSILLLTNPHNPLGVVYHASVIKNAISWARTRRIHTIVDELYALTTFRKVNHDFESVIHILNNKLGNDVHFLWALSKDFAASGFRIAILYTQNKRLLQSLSNLNVFSGVSHPMQMIMAEILMHDEFVDAFIAYSKSQIRHSYDLCTRKLDEMVIPYVAAEAGFFVYVDFSSVLPEATFEGEDLFARIVETEARVVMQPGERQFDHKPGYFRLCYTWVSPDVLEIGMERLSILLLRLRRGDLVTNVQ